MLAGLEESDTAMAHAQELLEVARESARRRAVSWHDGRESLDRVEPRGDRTFC